MLGGKNEYQLQEAAKVKTHLPDKFWEMPPKDAALALIEANCPLELKQKLRFVFDTGAKSQPPAKGEIGLRWEYSHCYIAERGVTILRYSGAASALSYSRVKLLDQVKKAALKRALDQTRRLPLPEETARRLYETIWWLCHIRASQPVEEAGHLMSTGDGHATFWVSPDLRWTDVTLYCSEISERYVNGIDEDLYANFAEFLLNTELAKRGADLTGATATAGRERPLSAAEKICKSEATGPKRCSGESPMGRTDGRSAAISKDCLAQRRY